LKRKKKWVAKWGTPKKLNFELFATKSIKSYLLQCWMFSTNNDEEIGEMKPKNH
jgi:hypothetical protein